MKNTHDKAICEKLAGLNSLPPGYEPNLDSKWKLLETAMLKRKDSYKRPVYIWMSIAASFLVICSLGIGVYFNQDKKNIAYKGSISSGAFARQKQPVHYLGEFKKLAKKPITHAAMAVTNRNYSTLHLAEITTQSLLAKHDTVLSLPDTIAENPQLETKNSSAFVQNVYNKKNKKRYVQFDFGDASAASIASRKQRTFSICFGGKGFAGEEANETDNINPTNKSLVLVTLNISR
jgi:uncharacterized membrane protein